MVSSPASSRLRGEGANKPSTSSLGGALVPHFYFAWGCFSKKEKSRPVSQHRATHAASSTEARHHVFGERQRSGEAGRFDAEQVHQPREAVLGGSVDDEIGGRLARAGQLWADAGIVGDQRIVRQRRKVAADRLVEGLAAARIDGVVVMVDPFDIRTE